MEKDKEDLEKFIDMQVANPQFMRDMLRIVGDQKPGYCYQCAKCTSGCPANLFLDFQPHKIVTMTRLGLRDQLMSLGSIWNCTTCMRCKDVCPQDVAPVDVIRGIRRIAVKSSLTLEGHKRIAKFLLSTGHLVPIDEKFSALRKKFGLSPIPPTTHKFPDALKEVREIIRITGFDKIVEGSK